MANSTPTHIPDGLATGKFLLVDDDREHLAMLERCLSSLGLAFASAVDGEQALALLAAEPFAICISDIQMPGLDGLELLRRIKSEYAATDVILMTGYSQTYTFTDVIREGATDYLEKPFTKDAVRAKILRILKERALLAEYHQELALRRLAEQNLLAKSNDLEETVNRRTRELCETQVAMEAVFQNIPDGILSVDGAMVVTHHNERCRQNLELAVGRPFTAGNSRFQGECFAVLSNSLTTQEAVLDYRIEIRQGEQVCQVVLVSTSLLRNGAQQISGALLIIHDITRLADLENQLQERRRFRQLIGKCPQLQEIYRNVRKLASVDTTVLITGESGTGKELLVETLHSSGNRAAKPLIKVNCAALPENLLESELFGHVRGAFTGAVRDRAGRIQAAEGGILLLDEIGDISPRIQLKLLRFLEVKEYERVGESQTRRADVRVFAATNADLARKVREGLFREDLYYRLKVMVIHLPPLRERKEDIPVLVEHFLAFFNKKFQKTIAGGSPEFLATLMGYGWPGNIRELKHVVEHAVLLSASNLLQPDDLPKDLLASGTTPATDDRQPARVLTRAALRAALGQTDGNKAKTARILKLSRATLYKKIREFDLGDDPSA
jgi:DNA-binding NtrC family response regulator